LSSGRWRITTAIFERAGTADDPGGCRPLSPAIVLLLTDDQRKDTVAALGGLPVRTPHQDALVRSGISFNNAYCMGGHVPAVCLPSRMMIQRGVSWFKAIKQAAPDPCIAKTMTNAGYVTYHFGKRGNEDTKAHQFYQHNHYVQPDDHVERRAGKPSRQMADHVTAFLKEHKSDKPFFLYLADAAPHDAGHGVVLHSTAQVNDVVSDHIASAGSPGLRAACLLST
jgi:arylsulfatase A-like enzyme